MFDTHRAGDVHVKGPDITIENRTDLKDLDELTKTIHDRVLLAIPMDNDGLRHACLVHFDQVEGCHFIISRLTRPEIPKTSWEAPSHKITVEQKSRICKMTAQVQIKEHFQAFAAKIVTALILPSDWERLVDVIVKDVR